MPQYTSILKKQRVKVSDYIEHRIISQIMGNNIICDIFFMTCDIKEEIMKVGIPKGLLYCKYHPFLVTFFSELGAEIKDLMNLAEILPDA